MGARCPGYQHPCVLFSLNTCFQIVLWISGDAINMQDGLYWGWKMVNGRYFPVISDMSPAPQQLMEQSDGIVKGTAQQEDAQAENPDKDIHCHGCCTNINVDEESLVAAYDSGCIRTVYVILSSFRFVDR